MIYPTCLRCGFPCTSSLAGPLGLRCQCINPILEPEQPTTSFVEEPVPEVKPAAKKTTKRKSKK